MKTAGWRQSQDLINHLNLARSEKVSNVPEELLLNVTATVRRVYYEVFGGMFVWAGEEFTALRHLS